MTTVLTLEPWWPGRGVTKKLFERKVCAAATVVEVTKGPDSIDDGLQELVDALAANQDDEVIVFGYSRGAQIIGRWLARYADAPDAPDPDRVTFLCCGNPERKYGGVPWMAKDRTRNDSRFRVTDVKLQYDSWCDWPAQTAGIAAVMAGSTLLGVTARSSCLGGGQARRSSGGPVDWRGPAELLDKREEVADLGGRRD
jgi:pimeloyl-ACP methyl ester carboxylesterase